jgi:hypothetical protein
MVQVPASTIVPLRSPAERAADEGLPIAERAVALKRWIGEDNDAAAVFVSQQLQQADDGEDWQFALVFATESIEFVRDEFRAEVASELRRIALALRGDGRPGVEPVVYCALARFGSLVDASNADGFVQFLDPVGYVDTRLAALKSIVHLFEMSPPRETHAVTRLCDRVAELAVKFLDGDVFLAGQNSAIAKEAIVAMAAVGDARLLELMRLALQVDRTWFRRELKRRLDELRALWVEHGVAGDHAAFRRLVSAIELIQL